MRYTFGYKLIDITKKGNSTLYKYFEQIEDDFKVLVFMNNENLFGKRADYFKILIRNDACPFEMNI